MNYYISDLHIGHTNALAFDARPFKTIEENDEKHYDEYFIVHADTFPKDKTEFTICLTIFRALQRMQNFGMVSNAVMTICDYDNPDGDKYEYDLSENENFEKLNAVEMGKLYRYGDGFKFQALGSGYVGGMTELFKNFGLDIDEGRD